MRKYLLLFLVFFPLTSFGALLSDATTTPPLTNTSIQIDGYTNNGYYWVLVNPLALTWSNTCDQNCGFNLGSTLTANGGFFNVESGGCADNVDEEGTWYIQCFDGTGACSSIIAVGVESVSSGSESSGLSTTTPMSFYDDLFMWSVLIFFLSFGVWRSIFSRM